MSEFSLILMLQKKQENPTIDMAKIQIKSERLTPFEGLFSIMEQFDSTLSSVIDSTLGLRCRSFGYQYSEIILSLAFLLNQSDPQTFVVFLLYPVPGKVVGQLDPTVGFAQSRK